MKKEKLREVPKKNYFILGIILIVSFLLIYYLYAWYDKYNEAKLNIPILDRYMEVINYNELEDYLVENPNAIIYVSVLENSEIRDFEKKFKTVLRKNEIDRELLYMDVTSNMKELDTNKYSIGESSIKDVPLVMVFENGNLKAIYDIKNNEYDVNQLKEFLMSIRFSSEDSLDG